MNITKEFGPFRLTARDNELLEARLIIEKLEKAGNQKKLSDIALGSSEQLIRMYAIMASTDVETLQKARMSDPSDWNKIVAEERLNKITNPR